MYVTAESIIQWAALLGAFGAIFGLIYNAVKWVERQNRQDEEIKLIKKEQCIMCYGLLATLDGLKQLGANGNVSDAYQKLEKHLNQSAHD